MHHRFRQQVVAVVASSLAVAVGLPPAAATAVGRPYAAGGAMTDSSDCRTEMTDYWIRVNICDRRASADVATGSLTAQAREVSYMRTLLAMPLIRKRVAWAWVENTVTVPKGGGRVQASLDVTLTVDQGLSDVNPAYSPVGVFVVVEADGQRTRHRLQHGTSGPLLVTTPPLRGSRPVSARVTLEVWSWLYKPCCLADVWEGHLRVDDIRAIA